MEEYYVDPNKSAKENFIAMLNHYWPNMQLSYEELVDKVSIYVLDKDNTPINASFFNSGNEIGSVKLEHVNDDFVFRNKNENIINDGFTEINLSFEGKPHKGTYGKKNISIKSIKVPAGKWDYDLVDDFLGTRENPIDLIITLPNVSHAELLENPIEKLKQSLGDGNVLTDGLLSLRNELCKYWGIPNWCYPNHFPIEGSEYTNTTIEKEGKRYVIFGWANKISKYTYPHDSGEDFKLHNPKGNAFKVIDPEKILPAMFYTGVKYLPGSYYWLLIEGELD